MLTGSKVEHVDVESGLVRLADGRQLESDLFIGKLSLAQTQCMEGKD